MDHPPLAAVLFDLDGSLIDSIELIVRSYEHTLATHDKKTVARDDILAGLGTPLWTCLRRYTSDEGELAAMIATYRAWNRAHHDELVRPFEGMRAALDALASRGLALGVVTSKAREAAWRGLEHCGLAACFEVLVGADDVERHKPDPTPVLAGCERVGVEPAAAAYVGDAVHDMVAARAAGTRAIGAGWGPFEAAVLVEAGAHVVLARPTELARLR
jgi:pyrophosphatase PpaX